MTSSSRGELARGGSKAQRSVAREEAQARATPVATSGALGPEWQRMITPQTHYNARMIQNGTIFRLTTRRVFAAALVMAASGALAVNAQPASASSHQPCKIEKHSTTAGITKVGTATATVVTDGVKLTTARSSNADKVSWRDSFKPVAASTVTEMSYETVKLDTTAGDNNTVNDAALPSYHVFVKTAAGEGVLIFEPY